MNERLTLISPHFSFSWGFEDGLMKEGDRFVHKSAQLEDVIRTLTDTHILVELDELNIFCSRIGSPQRFLKNLYHSLSAGLFHTRGSFYTRLISGLSSATQDSWYTVDRTRDALQDHAKRKSTICCGYVLGLVNTFEHPGKTSWSPKLGPGQLRRATGTRGHSSTLDSAHLGLQKDTLKLG